MVFTFKIFHFKDHLNNIKTKVPLLDSALSAKCWHTSEHWEDRQTTNQLMSLQENLVVSFHWICCFIKDIGKENDLDCKRKEAQNKSAKLILLLECTQIQLMKMIRALRNSIRLNRTHHNSIELNATHATPLLKLTFRLKSVGLWGHGSNYVIVLVKHSISEQVFFAVGLRKNTNQFIVAAG